MSNDPIETENNKEYKIKINTINEINDKNVKGIQELEESGDIFDFEPFLYSFKISPFSHSSSTMLMTIPGDRFHQDHAFGIIWLLFSVRKKSPSIFQLHWSLKFLQKLKSNDGTYTEDVNKCIQMIQDNLIKQYAKLGISLKHINESIKNDENIIITSTPKPKHVPRSLDMNMSRELIQFTNKDFNFQSCGKLCGKETIIRENASKIISFTYNEMISKGQVPCMEEVNYNYNILFETYNSSDSIKRFIKDLQLPIKLKFSTKNLKILSIEESVANMSMKELLPFFNGIRKEYVETIKKQVDKICSIENFVQNIDRNSFKAYITDDLIKCLNKLEDSNTEDSMEKLIL